MTTLGPGEKSEFIFDAVKFVNTITDEALYETSAAKAVASSMFKFLSNITVLFILT